MSIVSEGSASVPEYRYFTASIIDGSVLMEVPFSGVSWERKISTAGQFSGSIAADPTQDHFDLYPSTLPGKTALYVVRDGVCVWGGIIWSRDYDIRTKELGITALEFTSYLYHRIYWKTMTIPEVLGGQPQTVQDLIEQMIDAAFTDQSAVNEPLAYSASDVHFLVNSYQQTGTTVTLVTEEDHSFAIGNIVKIGGFATATTNGGRDYFNGVFTLTAVNTVARTITYTVGTTATINPAMNTAADLGGYVILNSTYNTINDSASINMQYDVMTSATADVDLSDYIIVGTGDNNPFTFRGSEMKYVGEILANFAANGVPSYKYGDPNQLVVSTRFDYYVECAYDPSTYSFTNTFKAWYVRKDVNTAAGSSLTTPGLETLYGPSEAGASSFIFEHPGNIAAFTMTENADASSSRTWMVDSGNDLNAGAEKYYGSYTNTPYLSEGWPILEIAITDRDLAVDTDEQVAPYAKAVGYRLAPPIGEYKITVNGSLDPKVGTYWPGDWCIVIPDDTFIRNRLKPPYENRENLLVRKIGSMKVTVPDNPTFPETVELDLIPEWEVD
jgi:hypothetical protein